MTARMNNLTFDDIKLKTFNSQGLRIQYRSLKNQDSREYNELLRINNMLYEDAFSRYIYHDFKTDRINKELELAAMIQLENDSQIFISKLYRMEEQK